MTKNTDIARLSDRILNEGSIPKRKQLVENLIEEATMQGYKRGFKEAEIHLAKATKRAEIEGQKKWITSHVLLSGGLGDPVGQIYLTPDEVRAELAKLMEKET
jgi:hypothetical protein